MDTGTMLKERLNELFKKSGGNKVRKEFSDWVEQAEGLEIVTRGRQMWDYLHSGKVSGFEKFVLGAALLYIVTPTDLLPDWLPVAGWLDDLGMAALVLAFIAQRLDAFEGGGKKGKGKRKKNKRKKKAKQQGNGAFAMG
jgi:uncharacterized membrane protein YkvA (DUF1232 family)